MVSTTDIEQLNSDCQTIFNEQLSVLETSLDSLPDKPEETAFSTLCTLWHYALGNPISCQVSADISLSNMSIDKFSSLKLLVKERLNGTPLAYIVGRQNFMGLELLSDPSALIPRKETEILAKASLGYIHSLLESQTKVKILDLFTGSGNLPLCFADRIVQANIFGADISEKAIELARTNAKQLNLPVQFKVSDMFDAFDLESFHCTFDLISSCPPYIIEKNVANMAAEISSHEPKLAFEAGPFGFTFFMRLIKESPKYLRKGGWLVFEVGLGQGDGIFRILGKSKYYDKVAVFNDNDKNIRSIAARKA